MLSEWKETCAKCMDGDIEPRHCEYYGEPNGCNAPTYGEHPPVGNAAAIREALEAAHEFVYTACRQNIDVMVKDKHGERVVKSKDVLYKIYSALSAPARNCDVGTADEQYIRYKKFCGRYFYQGPCNKCPAGESLDCRFAWAQMPYEGGAM